MLFYITEVFMEVQKVALSTDEAAVFTGFSRAYLYKLVSEKRIQHYRPFGKAKGRIYFKRDELEAFMFRKPEGNKA